MAVFKFSDEQAAVAAANDCHYGLGSSVFSASDSRARALGAQLRCGMTTLNDFGVNYLVQVTERCRGRQLAR